MADPAYPGRRVYSGCDISCFVLRPSRRSGRCSSNNDHAVASRYICRRTFSFSGTDNSHRTVGCAVSSILAQGICHSQVSRKAHLMRAGVHGSFTRAKPCFLRVKQ